MAGLLEALTLTLAPSLFKATLKLWLPKSTLLTAAGDSIIDIVKGRGENFLTAEATDRLFRNLAPEVAKRLQDVIDAEFGRLPDEDRIAAILSVSDVLSKLDLARDMMRADLDAAGLEKIAQPLADEAFFTLGGKSKDLAQTLLHECCAYAVTMAAKLPDFDVAATRELLKRTTELASDVTRTLDMLAAMRERSSGSEAQNNFETQYRRVVAQRLDRMQLFGLRLVGAGARELEISVAYVTLTSSRQQDDRPRDVDSALAGQGSIVVRGEAGSGKTTLLQWLAIRAANRDFKGALESWNAYVPFFVSLREYIEGFPPPEKLIARVAPNLVALMPPQWAHEVLARGALVLIDGLDEVPVARRPALLDWLGDLKRDFPNSRFIVSSRPAALDAQVTGGATGQRLSRLGFEQIALEPMSLSDSEALISQWHRAVGRDLDDAEVRAKLELYEQGLTRALRERPAIRNLASNPLLCAMICALNWDRQQQLPDSRMQLYGEALQMLLFGREAERGIVAARLAELDRPSKEALLDGIAFWMMRNGYTEAERSEVERQIAILLRRMTGLVHPPEEILQELLERSGVLRQPQTGVVDFIHRTFLEFMAARAAINAGDLGLLARQAKEDNWRETIVFAAGHASGKVRDELIAKLLKTPILAALSGRPTEIDVTAACCLETVSDNLDPALLKKLQARTEKLFPPKDMDAARILAPAARLDPDRLRGAAGGPEVFAACIRCAASVGGDAMLSVIESYAGEHGESVWQEILRAWTVFDPDAYCRRVIAKLTLDYDGFQLDLSEFDDDGLMYLECLVFRETSGLEPQELFGLLGSFLANRTVSLYSFSAHGERKIVKISDAARIARIKSLRHLYLSSSESGAAAAVAALPNLESLTFQPTGNSDIAAAAQCKKLKSISFDLVGMSSYSTQFPSELDCRPLASLPQLEKLKISFFGNGAELAVRLPIGSPLKSLSLIFPPQSAFAELDGLSKLERLEVQTTNFLNQEHDFRALSHLREMSLLGSGFALLYLPSSLEQLTLGFGNVMVANSDDLQGLSTLHLLGLTKQSANFRLGELRSLKDIYLDVQTYSSMDQIVWRAIGPNAKIHQIDTRSPIVKFASSFFS